MASAGNEDDLGSAFAIFSNQKVGGLILGADPLFLTRRKQLIALAARHAMPAVYFFHEFAADKGLVSYAPSLADGYRLGGVYVGRILKGENPADLPVMQPTKFDLVTNLTPRLSPSTCPHNCSRSPTR
jgi:putative tryptophan/tyrosine transport system substrate-binding protein